MVVVRWMGVRVALSEKLREGKLAIVDDLQAADLKTKAMGSMLTQRGWDNALFVQGMKYIIDQIYVYML